MSVQPSNVRYINVDQLCDEAEALGLTWADAKAAFEALRQTSKSVLAQAEKSYLGEGLTSTKAASMALADDKYIEFVKSMVKAGHAADRARVRYDIIQTRIELLRTNASTERAAMSMR